MCVIGVNKFIPNARKIHTGTDGITLIHLKVLVGLRATSMTWCEDCNHPHHNDVTINNLEQEGFTLIWKEESVEIWVQFR